ncbi:hypothetical protein QBC43DRAFT_64946 [Cladorrhinum sp. PSN259]|nr:hypothetical protein QBC43DRAFT_64946 [Cladorrhinum sp. PSN259]
MEGVGQGRIHRALQCGQALLVFLILSWIQTGFLKEAREGTSFESLAMLFQMQTEAQFHPFHQLKRSIYKG